MDDSRPQHRSPDSDLPRLLRDAASGDPRAWHDLVQLYSKRVYALAKSRCRSHDVAEEITQSVFATLAERLGRQEYQELGKFEAWIFRITINRVRDHIRRLKRRPASEPIHDDTVQSEDPGLAEGTPALDRLREALHELPDADQEVVHLRHFAQLSFAQMADLLEEPVGTLLARHHRALKKLRTILERADQGARQELTP
ncbi:MAG: RNA polymerase sigma factor [Phycisphaerales bacterium]|nr:MAG: sigma-70 family RNA polymerase sigma factor [Phycisphaerales bacterium]